MKRMLIFLMLLSIMASLAYAEQTVKTIELPLQYVASAVANTNYSGHVNVSSPDGIADILSFELVLKGDFAATTRVYGRVGEQLVACSPSYWTTPSVVSNNYDVIFDCTSLIEQTGFAGGNVKMGFMVNKNAANVKPFIRITYLNDPKVSAHVFGTEYQVGDRATVFLQLKDDQDFPENDASCRLSIFYPYLVNSSHPIYIDDAPMLIKEGGLGLYYYDLVVPNYTGVYMLSASCTYAFSGGFVYQLDEFETYYPLRTTIYGTFVGSSFFLNQYEDWVYTKCSSQIVGGSKICDAYYDFNTTVHFSNDSLNNVTEINLFYSGEASGVVTGIFYWYNWTNTQWVALPNNILFSGSAATVPIGVGDFSSNSVPIEAIDPVTKLIRVRFYISSGTGFNIFSNWLNIELKTASGSIHEIKGSGEIHASDFAIQQISLLQQIWTWLTVTLWEKLLGIESKVNTTINNTETLIYDIQGNSTEEASVKEILTRPVMVSIT